MGLHANFRRLVIVCACVVLAGACTRDGARPETGVVETERPEASAEPTAAPGTSSGGCAPRRAAPPDLVPHYDMTMRVDPDAALVAGRSVVTFVAEKPTRRIVFRLWPNGPRLAGEGARLTVPRAELRKGRVEVERPDPTTLVLSLEDRLTPGTEVVVRMPWRLDLPGAILDRISRNGDSVRLGSFFPILAWEGARGWATDPPTTTLAESSVSPTADFDVTIDVPQGLDVIATGREKAAGRWEAEDVRDFAVAVGRFETVRTRVDAGRPVDVVVGVASGLDADERDFATAIERALRDLSRRYGEYPWPTFSMAIVPDLGRSGIEYPGMIFQGEQSLRTATTHEVAHSWFYGLVGNNQARDPWLDEGVTSWAQARADGDLGYFRGFDVPDAVAGRLGRGMTFWDRHEEDYYAGAYVQGVQALDAFGNPRRVDCALKRYVAQNAYDVATNDDLLAAFRQSFPRARRVLARFGVPR